MILLFIKEKSQLLYNFSDIVTIKLFEISFQYLYNNLVQVNVACIQCELATIFNYGLIIKHQNHFLKEETSAVIDLC